METGERDRFSAAYTTLQRRHNRVTNEVIGEDDNYVEPFGAPTLGFLLQY
jgi:hypothetical protein